MKKMMLVAASLIAICQINAAYAEQPQSFNANNKQTSQVSAMDSKQQQLDKQLGRILLDSNIDVKEVENLIKNGANVNRDLSNDFTPEKPNQGMTPLIVLLTGNPNFEITQTLISAGADVNAMNVEGRTPLMYAISLNDGEKFVNALIKAGADVNAVVRSDGLTPLMIALLKPNNMFVIDSLIRAGANVNAKDIYGKTPLMYAAEYNPDALIINALVKKGAMVNEVSDNGETPLMYAIRANANVAVISTLIALGADVNISSNQGLTALALAQHMGRYDISQKLSEVGGKVVTEQSQQLAEKTKTIEKKKFAPSKLSINERKLFYLVNKEKVTPEELTAAIARIGVVNFADANSNTPLIVLASKCENTASIKVLLDSKAEVNAVNNADVTPLIAAVKFNKNPEVIKTLAAAGADTNVRIAGGKNLLMIALENPNNYEIVKTLIEAGADINQKDDTGYDLMNTVISFYPDRMDLVDLLIKSNLDLNSTDRNGLNHVMVAITKNASEDLVKKLLAAGEDIKAVDRFGEDAMELAARYSMNPSMIKTLSEKGFDVNKKNSKGITPLMTAATYNPNEKVTKALIDLGADINAMTPQEETPLMLAVMNNKNVRVVKTLIDAGANINGVNKHGDTVLSLAKRNNNVDAVNALTSAGAVLTAPKTRALREIDNKLFDLLAKKDATLADVEKMVREGANVNAEKLYSVTPLMIAAGNVKDPAIVKFLLDSKVGINKKSDDEETPLMYAAKSSESPEIVDMLINAGANVASSDKEGNTPLAIAAKNNKNAGVITALIKGGSDVNRKNRVGISPLFLAVENNTVEVVKALIDGKANVDIRKDNGETPLITTVRNSKIDEKIAELLLSSGADPYTEDKTNKSAFDYAKVDEKFRETNAYKIMMSKPSGTVQDALNKTLLLLVRNPSTNRGQVEKMITAGANPNSSSKDEFLTYMSAAGELDPQLVKDVLRIGGYSEDDNSVIYTAATSDEHFAFLKALAKGKVELSETLSTPLMLAAANVEDPEVIKYLIKSGADIERRDIYGNTPLMYAAYGAKNEDIINAFLEAGVNTRAKNVAGKTALDYIKENPNLKKTNIISKL